ncbi:hypothetical protein Acr_26g0009780 [Actinidia rufa]|uniref:Uncharacterized protein n=1 Tax=Actinidia rufa TaxID=165716 RepID=A0A7J0H3W2_9ERIC|nr:hypothetical protein Acr_26g0009780 [Actinidia rufa]
MMGDGKLVKGDKLISRRVRFWGFHGVKLEEERPGRKLWVDVDPVKVMVVVVMVMKKVSDLSFDNMTIYNGASGGVADDTDSW